MNPEDDALPFPHVQTLGEVTKCQMTWTWISGGISIPPGARLGQYKLVTDAAKDYEEFALILADLGFALDCFTEANQLGEPNANHTHSRALIQSGTVAYSRPFTTGVRRRLTREKLEKECSDFDAATHDYLIALRDKHYAHSVNSFERAEAFGVVVAKPGDLWREGNAVGVVVQTAVGLSHDRLRAAIALTEKVKSWIESEIKARNTPLYKEFRAAFVPSSDPQVVPFMVEVDRRTVAKRR